MFQKSAELFPVKNEGIFLAHCAISPLPKPAVEAMSAVAEAQMKFGARGISAYGTVLEKIRTSAARLLNTDPDNLAFVKNTSEAMGMVANGYPFEPGDQVLSYVHEYPANHYPWKLQERRGVELVLLPDRSQAGVDTGDRPCGWSMEDVERLVTDRTRVVAVSHVQFTSGFAADLETLGDFCRRRGIDLVVDAAQSLGCLALDPEKCHISAIAASGWKWLFGPTGTGLFYTAPQFRAKLKEVLVGAECMVQGDDYLNHTWQPHPSARRFEYATTPTALAAALETCLSSAVVPYSPQDVQREVFRLQDRLLEKLDQERYVPLRFSGPHRSGILSFMVRENPDELMARAAEKGVFVSSRCGYLRMAPHWCTTDEEIDRAAEVLNHL